MSDLHEPDLDRAFAALTSDLSAHSSAPGARAAIATARTRRRARGGAVALVAAAAVGAVVIPQLVGGTDGSSVAGSRDLPAAAAMTPESLTAATDGWVGSWQTLDETNASSLEGLDSNCLGEVGGPDAEPTRIGDQVFVAEGGAAAAIAIFVDYADSPSAAGEYAAAFTRAMGACGASVSESARGDAVVAHGSAGGTAGQDVDEVWFARLGDRVAVFAVLGTPSPAPPDTTGALTDLVLRALQESSSYDLSSGALDVAVDGGSSSGTPQSFDTLPLDRIREATGSWSQGWSDRASTSSDHLPCVPGSWPQSAAWAQGATIGDRGILTYAGTDEAAAEVGVLAETLSACDGAQWSVRSGAGARGSAAWASSELGSVFLAERGDAVAMLQVRGLGVPTDEIAAELIGLLDESLSNPGSGPVPSEPEVSQEAATP